MVCNFNNKLWGGGYNPRSYSLTIISIIGGNN